MNRSCLIGSTGFVGTTLLGQSCFDDKFHSTDISLISGRSYDLIVSAGAPAKKWLANKEPEKDRQSIDNLISFLKKVRTKQFVLISTVDVFQNPNNVDESSLINTEGLHPYGLNRYYLEEFVKEKFENHLIVRLPGLVGRGLRKNILFDFAHNKLEQIESRNIFQFYPMSNLWRDIQIALDNNLKVVHLTAEPISVKEIAKECFGINFSQKFQKHLVSYDMRSQFSHLWNAERYQYTKEQSLQAIKCYADESREQAI